MTTMIYPHVSVRGTRARQSKSFPEIPSPKRSSSLGSLANTLQLGPFVVLKPRPPPPLQALAR